MNINNLNLEGEKIVSSIDNKISNIESGIFKNYNISQGELESLYDFKLLKGKESISFESSEYQKALIQEIKNQHITSKEKQTLSSDEVTRLSSQIIQIQSFKQEIQKQAILQREDLKLGLKDIHKEGENLFSSTKLSTHKLYSQETLKKIQNPKNLSDHLLGAGIGALDTIIVIGKFGYDVGKGILTLPYDAYLLLSKKATLDTKIDI